MREIASEAGYANGALKHYFPGKDEIIAGAYARAIATTGERVAGLVGDRTGIEALRIAIRAIAPMDEEAVESARILVAFWDHSLSNPGLRADYQAHLDGWRRELLGRIADCRAEGTIRIATPDETLADEVILLVVGATVLSVVGPRPATEQLLDRQLDSFFERIARP